jgi:hypothetical protein
MPECGIPNRQKRARATDLSCKNDYYTAPANPNGSTSYRFFTDDDRFLIADRLEERAPEGVARKARPSARAMAAIDRPAARKTPIGSLSSSDRCE